MCRAPQAVSGCDAPLFSSSSRLCSPWMNYGIHWEWTGSRKLLVHCLRHTSHTGTLFPGCHRKHLLEFILLFSRNRAFNCYPHQGKDPFPVLEVTLEKELMSAHSAPFPGCQALLLLCVSPTSPTASGSHPAWSALRMNVARRQHVLCLFLNGWSCSIWPNVKLVLKGQVASLHGPRTLPEDRASERTHLLGMMEWKACYQESWQHHPFSVNHWRDYIQMLKAVWPCRRAKGRSWFTHFS